MSAVFNENDDHSYSHHEILLTAFPLAIEWLDYDPEQPHQNGMELCLFCCCEVAGDGMYRGISVSSYIYFFLLFTCRELHCSWYNDTSYRGMGSGHYRCFGTSVLSWRCIFNQWWSEFGKEQKEKEENKARSKVNLD